IIVKYPVGWGEFPGVTFCDKRGRNRALGFVILGLPKRLIERGGFEGMRTGAVLRMLHDNGYSTHSMHANNLTFLADGRVCVHDLDLLQNWRDGITKEEMLARQLFDFVYVLGKQIEALAKKLGPKGRDTLDENRFLEGYLPNDEKFKELRGMDYAALFELLGEVQSTPVHKMTHPFVDALKRNMKRAGLADWTNLGASLGSEPQVAQQNAIRGGGEDRYVSERLLLKDVPHGCGQLLALMDGHGSKGVSSYIANRLGGLFPLYMKYYNGDLKEVLGAVFGKLKLELKHSKDGSTAIIVYVPDDELRAYIGFIGDSFAVIEDKNGKVVTNQVHNIRYNPAERGKALSERGAILLKDSKGGDYIGRKVGGTGLQLSRTLGVASLDGIVGRDHDFYIVDIKPGSLIALASDGLLCDDPSLPYVDQVRLFVKRLKSGASPKEIVKAAASETGDDATLIMWHTPKRSGASLGGDALQIGRRGFLTTALAACVLAPSIAAGADTAKQVLSAENGIQFVRPLPNDGFVDEARLKLIAGAFYEFHEEMDKLGFSDKIYAVKFKDMKPEEKAKVFGQYLFTFLYESGGFWYEANIGRFSSAVSIGQFLTSTLNNLWEKYETGWHIFSGIFGSELATPKKLKEEEWLSKLSLRRSQSAEEVKKRLRLMMCFAALQYFDASGRCLKVNLRNADPNNTRAYIEEIIRKENVNIAALVKKYEQAAKAKPKDIKALMEKEKTIAARRDSLARTVKRYEKFKSVIDRLPEEAILWAEKYYTALHPVYPDGDSEIAVKKQLRAIEQLSEAMKGTLQFANLMKRYNRLYETRYGKNLPTYLLDKSRVTTPLVAEEVKTGRDTEAPATVASREELLPNSNSRRALARVTLLGLAGVVSFGFLKCQFNSTWTVLNEVLGHSTDKSNRGRSLGQSRREFLTYVGAVAALAGIFGLPKLASAEEKKAGDLEAEVNAYIKRMNYPEGVREDLAKLLTRLAVKDGEGIWEFIKVNDVHIVFVPDAYFENNHAARIQKLPRGLFAAGERWQRFPVLLRDSNRPSYFTERKVTPKEYLSGYYVEPIDEAILYIVHEVNHIRNLKEGAEPEAGKEAFLAFERDAFEVANKFKVSLGYKLTKSDMFETYEEDYGEGFEASERNNTYLKGLGIGLAAGVIGVISTVGLLRNLCAKNVPQGGCGASLGFFKRSVQELLAVCVLWGTLSGAPGIAQEMAVKQKKRPVAANVQTLSERPITEEEMIGMVLRYCKANSKLNLSDKDGNDIKQAKALVHFFLELENMSRRNKDKELVLSNQALQVFNVVEGASVFPWKKIEYIKVRWGAKKEMARFKAKLNLDNGKNYYDHVVRIYDEEKKKEVDTVFSIPKDCRFLAGTWGIFSKSAGILFDNPNYGIMKGHLGINHIYPDGKTIYVGVGRLGVTVYTDTKDITPLTASSEQIGKWERRIEELAQLREKRQASVDSKVKEVELAKANGGRSLGRAPRWVHGGVLYEAQVTSDETRTFGSSLGDEQSNGEDYKEAILAIELIDSLKSHGKNASEIKSSVISHLRVLRPVSAGGANKYKPDPVICRFFEEKRITNSKEQEEILEIARLILARVPGIVLWVYREAFSKELKTANDALGEYYYVDAGGRALKDLSALTIMIKEVAEGNLYDVVFINSQVRECYGDDRVKHTLELYGLPVEELLKDKKGRESLFEVFCKKNNIPVVYVEPREDKYSTEECKKLGDMVEKARADTKARTGARGASLGKINAEEMLSGRMIDKFTGLNGGNKPLFVEIAAGYSSTRYWFDQVLKDVPDSEFVVVTFCSISEAIDKYWTVIDRAGYVRSK
ncbi:MAG: PP2C family serine/threonine-protein phosphatase, partial [Candidatus Omnitrophica bacterium]|nr:PP2C family serine/threonine-protein phosphatase [Candidatus Omnitrophota bacterium]